MQCAFGLKHSLTVSLFAEVPISYQESGWSCICILWVSSFPLLIIFCKYYDNDTNVDIKFSEHDTFLE